jgi:CspA family cold shock protein
MTGDPGVVRGIVRTWSAEEGWGIIDSPATPGGCWAHFSSLQMKGYRAAQPLQSVAFTFETAEQDGFDYRAVEVRLD